jgi:putative component of toxin-antitoxin plasmid stabilization module
MVVVREYVDEAGYSPFRAWFGSLDGQAAIKVTVALERIADGHTSAMKALGEGISEYKKRQQQDIVRAKAVWQDYKRRRE